MITSKGLSLVDVFLGPDGILTGSAREAYQLQEETGKVLRSNALLRKDREINRQQNVVEGKVAALQLEFESMKEELNRIYLEEELKKEISEKNRRNISTIRKGGKINIENNNNNKNEY